MKIAMGRNRGGGGGGGNSGFPFVYKHQLGNSFALVSQVTVGG